MIRDRYPAAQLAPLFSLDALSRIDPALAVLDPLLDDPALFGLVKADFLRRHPQSATRGRLSTPVEVILRMLLLRRLYDWTHEETERLVWDSISLRQFCRIGTGEVPDDTTLIRWEGCLRPETMQQLHARVVAIACQRGVTRGKWLRVDGTVVETEIHHPTDSALLVDGVRMLSRLAAQAQATGAAATGVVRNLTRGARRLGRAIGEALRKGEAERQRLYRRLLRVTRTALGQARAVQALLPATNRLRQRLADCIRLTEQVVRQTVRRVLQGEQVPASEKIVSLAEPHSAILTRRERSDESRYGHRIILGESDGRILTTYAILPGTEPEAAQLLPAVEQHRRHIGRLPGRVTTDGGFYAPGQTETLEALGIKRVVIPTPGKDPPARERTRWFRAGRRLRVGIEGRISVCKRRGWLGRCRDHGRAGFDKWVGWGVLANNLVAIARYETTRRQKQAA